MLIFSISVGDEHVHRPYYTTINCTVELLTFVVFAGVITSGGKYKSLALKQSPS